MRKIKAATSFVSMMALIIIYSGCTGSGTESIADSTGNQSLVTLKHWVESENIDWRDQLDSLVLGREGQKLCKEFNGDLKLLSYQMGKTININNLKDSLFIDPITKETLVPLCVDSTLNKFKFKLIRISKSPIPASQYMELKASRIKRFGNQYQIVKFKWDYQGEIFTTQGLVSKAIHLFVYDNILSHAVVLESKIDTTVVKQRIKKDYLFQTDPSLYKKNTSDLQKQGGDSLFYVMQENESITRKIRCKVPCVPEFLEATATDDLKVSGFLVYNPLHRSSKKYLDGVHSNGKSHAGLFYSASSGSGAYYGLSDSDKQTVKGGKTTDNDGVIHNRTGFEFKLTNDLAKNHISMPSAFDHHLIFRDYFSPDDL